MCEMQFQTAEGEDGDVEADEEVEIPFPNLPEIMSNFEQGGVSLSGGGEEF